ncbi:MAG: LysR family transcriptional regulator, partial [Pseudobdellovibrio sp.]
MSLLSPPLEAFWAVVRKGTVQDASYILGITQTGVTQRIRSLEKQLKTTLFIRSRKGMKLTTEGEALLQFVKGSLEIEGMALSKIQRAAKDSIT